MVKKMLLNRFQRWFDMDFLKNDQKILPMLHQVLLLKLFLLMSIEMPF